MNIDLSSEPLGQDKNGNDVYLKDIWPTSAEIAELVEKTVTREAFQSKYADVFKGDEKWQAVETTDAETYDWPSTSTYIQNPPYFQGMSKEPGTISNIEGARVLALLGDMITTDHISPAGAIKPDSPAGAYLQENGVTVADFNSYGSRRGNDRIMTRGTFANVRIKNLMVPGVEGGVTKYFGTGAGEGEQMAIFDAADKYKADGTPLVVLAGQEYGTGSSRDWAAKGTMLLGVRAVLATSFERIHRSNLVGMGVLPLVLPKSWQDLGLTGEETFDIPFDGLTPRGTVEVTVTKPDGTTQTIPCTVRIDTPVELDQFRAGGILPFVLRKLLA